MRYHLSCQVTVTAFTTVDAASLEDAILIAKDRDVTLSDGGADEESAWVISEADGSPTDIHEG